MTAILSFPLCIILITSFAAFALPQEPQDPSKNHLAICGRNVSEPCITAPKQLKSPKPKYSEEARKAKLEGVVVLRVVIGPDGIPRDIKVARSLGKGLDEEAIKAVA